VDRTLIFAQEILDIVTENFNKLKSSILDVKFEIWTEISENFQYSYYLNEQMINPVKESFDDWKFKLSQRPKPLYSVALKNDNIISSVYGAELSYERTMNLWITKPDFRQKGIGKTVLLNFIKHCFENNPDMQIKAWDVTSKQIDEVLIKIGFI
jgi:RimJ/RimL family protein N-acetyltransferase